MTVTGFFHLFGQVVTDQELWQQFGQSPVQDLQDIVSDAYYGERSHLTDPIAWDKAVAKHPIYMVPHDLQDEMGGSWVIGIELENCLSLFDLLKLIREKELDPYWELITLPNDCHCCS